MTTLQLEWEKLSQHTGDPKYAQYSRRAMRAVRSVQPHDGLHPMWIDPQSGACLVTCEAAFTSPVVLCRTLDAVVVARGSSVGASLFVACVAVCGCAFVRLH